jgi:hypothetical protein
MTYLRSALPIALACLLPTVAWAQDEGGLTREEADELRSRLERVEEEQARSRETIRELRAELDESRRREDARNQDLDSTIAELVAGQAETVRLLDGSAARPRGKGGRDLFPELAHDAQFVLSSRRGDFSLAIDGLIMGRWEFNRRKDDGTGSSETDQGFEMTASRIYFQGSVYGDWGYYWRINGDDFGDPEIDAYVMTWEVAEGTTLVFGQMPSLLTREQALSAHALQVQESTPTNYYFDPFGFKGLMLSYRQPRYIVRAIVHDGFRSLSNSAFDAASADWAVAGQFSYLASGEDGDWGRWNNFTSRPGSSDAWLLSAAFSAQQGSENLDPDGDESDLFWGCVESSWEGSGWNLFGAGYLLHSDPSTIGDEATDWGFVVQGGMWVATHLETYGRFDMTIPDGDRPVENEDFRTITAGVNYYPIPDTDNIKYGLEILYMLDAESESVVEPNVNSSVQASPEGDQVVVRMVFSLRW